MPPNSWLINAHFVTPTEEYTMPQKIVILAQTLASSEKKFKQVDKKYATSVYVILSFTFFGVWWVFCVY